MVLWKIQSAVLLKKERMVEGEVVLRGNPGLLSKYNEGKKAEINFYFEDFLFFRLPNAVAGSS